MEKQKNIFRYMVILFVEAFMLFSGLVFLMYSYDIPSHLHFSLNNETKILKNN